MQVTYMVDRIAEGQPEDLVSERGLSEDAHQLLSWVRIGGQRVTPRPQEGAPFHIQCRGKKPCTHERSVPRGALWELIEAGLICWNGQHYAEQERFCG